MARDLFMLVLALLTLATGGALAVMIVRRRRARRQLRGQTRGTPHAGARATGRRRAIDDYASPVGFDGPPPGSSARPTRDRSVGTTLGGSLGPSHLEPPLEHSLVEPAVTAGVERALKRSVDPNIGVGLEPERPHTDLLEAAKICPQCARRYSLERRFCEHDDSELAALN